MGFRKNRNDEWRIWLNQNSHHLMANCGVPEYIIKDEKRWFIFLDHGYDEVGWYEDQHMAWDINRLSPEEAKNFYDFIKIQYGNKYNSLLDEISQLFNMKENT